MSQPTSKLRLIAIGDIHGCFNSFKTLVENKVNLAKTDKLVLLGDYIDKGTQCKEVIDYVINLQKQNYNIVTLLGNHESLLLNALAKPELLSKWILNGGNATLKSFGIDKLSELDTKYLDFFNKLKPYYACQDYLFVHAGFNDDIEDPFSDTYSMLWKCRDKYKHSSLNNRVIVHAHYPISTGKCLQSIKNGNNVINIDTGCVYKDRDNLGVLTALDIITRTIHFV